MILRYKIPESSEYTKIIQVLKNEFHLSQRLILKLKTSKQIYLNDIPMHVNALVTFGDIISCDISFEEESDNIVPRELPLDILYEDEGLLVVNKPPNMPVHPSINHYEDTLSNTVKWYFDSIGLKRKIRPVNRLDKDTSGIVIFAKNEYVQESLVHQMKDGTFEKEYYAIVNEIIEEKNFTVIANIARTGDSIIERCVDENGDYAETEFELVNTFSDYSLLKCKLKTGRTHQIRVHTKHIGHPILSDTLYGDASDLISRQALHAYSVKFVNPVTNRIVNITCPIPKDMESLVN